MRTHSQNAIDILTLDHRKVLESFAKYNDLKDSDYDTKVQLVHNISMDLLAHMQAEEDAFYPIIESLFDDHANLIKEAYIEHEGAKEVIQKLKKMASDDEFYDATVKVLSEQIEHHVEEEEDQIFPKVQHSGLDLNEIGAKIQQIKEKFMEHHPKKPE